jgi:hypothetical protein
LTRFFDRDGYVAAARSRWWGWTVRCIRRGLHSVLRVPRRFLHQLHT